MKPTIRHPRIAALALGLLLLPVEPGRERPFFRQRRLVLAARALEDLGHFRLNLGFGVRDGDSDLHHIWMIRAQLFGELRPLPQQLRQLGLLLLNERIGQDEREAVDGGRVLLNGLDLVVCRFLLDADGIGFRHRGNGLG